MCSAKSIGKNTLRKRRRRDRKYRNGTEVFVVKDCRDEHKATGELGRLECRINLSTGKRYRGPNGMWANPRIRLRDGSAILGIECWWIPVQEGVGTAIGAGMGAWLSGER